MQASGFDAVMPEIPTNSIINKTVTGCGATYAEINAPRHSVIIIEPNVPVIEGKMKKHPQILGVFEGVTTEDIIDFLNTNYNDGYLKIMTTPESFPKSARRWCRRIRICTVNGSCCSTSASARYRMQATAARSRSRWMIFPMQAKAMVSATPIIPSDPRFEQQGFTMKILRPTYAHKPKILLIHTNNTVGWVRTLMGQVKGKRASALHLSELDRYDPPHDLHL